MLSWSANVTVALVVSPSLTSRALCTNDKESQDHAASLGIVSVVVELMAREGPAVRTGVTLGLRLW